jgi:hypothetical protein
LATLAAAATATPPNIVMMGRLQMAKASLIPAERVEHAIIRIRGQNVMLDRDLAVLYGVPTKGA